VRGACSSEVFLYDLLNNTVRQITDSVASVSNGQVSLSGDGTRMAFTSTGNLLGTNADGNQEIFVFDVMDNLLTQMTSSVGFTNFSIDPSISADGSTLAFISAANLTGNNQVARGSCSWPTWHRAAARCPRRALRC
jgi:Tol biopolymer transport system component